MCHTQWDKNSSRAKASHKMLVNLDTGVNFINMLTHSLTFTYANALALHFYFINIFILNILQSDAKSTFLVETKLNLKILIQAIDVRRRRRGWRYWPFMNPFFASHTTQQRSEKNGPHVCFFTVVQRIPKIVKMINDIKTNSLEHHLKIFTLSKLFTFLVGYLVFVTLAPNWLSYLSQKFVIVFKNISEMVLWAHKL